jgi:membrane peptidoglycan carboxypeptidase
MIAAAALVVVAWPLTPSVDDAPGRVAILLAGQHAPSLGSLPSPNLVGDAVIATENSRFFSDFGPDPISLVRTGISSVTGGRDRGAATLEMQLGKNLYTPGRRSLGAKLAQVELAFKLDHHYSKRTILEMYLDGAYYGHGYYGLASAARGYFEDGT